MMQPRFSLIFAALQASLAADPDVSIPAENVYFGAEFLPEHASPRRIVFAPTGGPIGMADHSGKQQWPPTPADWNPQHLRTWKVSWDVYLWGGLIDDWTPDTAYLAGQYVQNDGNAYTVATPGTSAASGGPTGTGSGIPDGTNGLTWNYAGLPGQTPVEYDDCADMLQALVRALNANLAGSYRFTQDARFGTASGSQTALGRGLQTRIEIQVPLVAPTLPTAPQPPNTTPIGYQPAFSVGS